MQMDQSYAAAPDSSVSVGRYTLTSATQVADKAALDDLLSDYYGLKAGDFLKPIKGPRRAILIQIGFSTRARQGRHCRATLPVCLGW